MFPLGTLTATPAALEKIESTGSSVGDIMTMHLNLEQGVLPDEDHAMNQDAVDNGERIFSAFGLNDGSKVWVITEADRSSTTILLPDEY